MEKILEKNQEYVVEIIDQGYEGEGIAKINQIPIFIPNALKGEICKIVIVKVLTSYAYGKILEIVKTSKDRVESDCLTDKRCGGCDLRHISYARTLEMKREIVQNLVQKILKQKVEVRTTIGMEHPMFYRNKAQYPFGIDPKGNPTIGIFAKRSHEIIPIQECKIQNEISQRIAKTTIEFCREKKLEIYNETSEEGILRHLVVRVGFTSNEVMCIFVVNEKNGTQKSNWSKYKEELYNQLETTYPEIKTIVENQNNKKTNVILGDRNQVIFGEGFIYDQLADFTFKISPMSFYQINPIQTVKLYTKAIEEAELKKDDIFCDLYCGIGTIGIFVAKHVKKVYGVEIVPEAIQDAKINAQINQIQNTEFMTGDVKDLFDQMIQKDHIKPTVVCVDPPRKGIDPTTIENIKQVEPNKVIYISCNPATMVRDLAMLEEKYLIKSITPVDMFPYTSHVECVTILELKRL